MTMTTHGTTRPKISVIVVAGTSSGVGKTTVACGLMAAFARRGLIVQPFKVGPDFLDGKHHESAVRSCSTMTTAVAGTIVDDSHDDDSTRQVRRDHTTDRPQSQGRSTQSKSQTIRKSINLDGWMMMGKYSSTSTSTSTSTDNKIDKNHPVLESFDRHAAGADVCIIEGVMGLFDGRDGTSDEGSTAQIAKWLGAPVLLVVDAGMMARSVAPMVLGFTLFDRDMRLGGVIVNKVGGVSHKKWIADALKDEPRLIDVGTGEHVLFCGGFPMDNTASVPERHLGLQMPACSSPDTHDNSDHGHDDRIRFMKLAALMEENITLDSILTLGRTTLPRERAQEPQPTLVPTPSCIRPTAVFTPPHPRCRIGIAQDEAFCFYYHDNLRLLQLAGAELVPFSPISPDGALPPALDALYIGGGYPELHAAELEDNIRLRNDILSFARAGGAIFAECGGLMYLTDALLVDAKAPTRKMCGVIPNTFARMTPHMKMYYAEIEFGPDQTLFPVGMVCRGQKFHFSETMTVHDHTGDGLGVGEYQGGGTGDRKTMPPSSEAVTTTAPILVTPQTPGAEREPTGYAIHNTVASYLHVHFASNPLLADAFIQSAIAYSPRRRRFEAVSFVSAATEIVFALHAEGCLGGVTSICDYPPIARSTPRSIVCRSPFDPETMTSEEVEIEMTKMKRRRQRDDEDESGGKKAPSSPPGYWIIDRSELRRLAPQVAFVQNTCDICDPAQDDILVALHESKLVGRKDENGIIQTTDDDRCKLVLVAPSTLEGLFKSIQDVAIALDCTTRGEELRISLSNRLQRIQRFISKLTTKRPRVLSLEGLAPLCTGGHWLPDLKAAAGCEDALGDIGGAPARILSWNDILDADPDVLLISPCSASPDRTMRELHLLASAPEFWKLRCVRGGEVYVLDHGKFSRPGPRLIEGVEMLATLLRGVPAPASVEENDYDLWKDEAYKYQCSVDITSTNDEDNNTCGDTHTPLAKHCTTELASRFSPCFGFNKKKGLDDLILKSNTTTVKNSSFVTSNYNLERCSVTRCTIPNFSLPVNRSAHCLVSSGNTTSSFLLFGGEDSQGNRLSDVWKLHAPSDGWPAAATTSLTSPTLSPNFPQLGTTPTWEFIRCGKVADEDVPTPRSNAACVVCGTDHLLIFGGWGADNVTPLDNCELLHLETFCWTHCSTTMTNGGGGSGEQSPPPRGNPTLVYSQRNDYAILFGGWDASRRFDDIWCLDMQLWNWQQVIPSLDSSGECKNMLSSSLSNWPRPRTDHTAVLWEIDDGREIMLVYGGSVEGGGGEGLSSLSSCASSELWALDCSDSCQEQWYWYELELDKDSPIPPVRTSHAAAMVGKGNLAAMIVVGGTDSSIGTGRGSILSDAWILSLSAQGKGHSKGRWSKLDWDKNISSGPGIEQCRLGMASNGSTIVIWGGYDGEGCNSTTNDDEASIWMANVKITLKDTQKVNKNDNPNRVPIVQGICGKGTIAESSITTGRQTQTQKQTQRLQERWDAEVPLRVKDLPPEMLAKAQKSLLPGALYKTLHRQCVAKKRDTYIDPASGYSVFTQCYLKRRPCCGNACRHCPHAHVNVPKKNMNLDW